ncbi:hypothetical protein Tco_0592682 [Tanacetum coccineum]
MSLCPYDHHKAATDINWMEERCSKKSHPLLAQKVSKEIASCVMVGRLAGELSYVTCKVCFSVEGLIVSSNLLEHAMQLIIDENLEPGRESIEKAAIDKIPSHGLVDYADLPKIIIIGNWGKVPHGCKSIGFSGDDGVG